MDEPSHNTRVQQGNFLLNFVSHELQPAQNSPQYSSYQIWSFAVSGTYSTPQSFHALRLLHCSELFLAFKDATNDVAMV